MKERILKLFHLCQKNGVRNLFGASGDRRFFIGDSKIYLFGQDSRHAARVEVDLSRLEEFDPPKAETLFLSFAEKGADPAPDRGTAVRGFLDRLRLDGVDYKVMHPLPGLFPGDTSREVLEEYGIPADCGQCLDRLSVQEDDTVVFCHGGMGRKFDRYWKKGRLSEDFEGTAAGQRCFCASGRDLSTGQAVET